MSGLHKVWLGFGWLWILLVCYLSLMPHPPQPVSFEGVDKLEHLLAYVGLMLWFCQVYVTRASRIGVLVGLVALGVGIEILQGMGGYRYSEYADMLANTGGVLMGWGLAHTRMGRAILLLERNGKH
ncbi:MAG: VanZ family protein [Gammaproteobacteria bacterium]|nr:VanZ family protein [Sideroxydans sp.]MBU3902776.1 VanZ family protein [Gammaproteobacteria bacterium]MBU4045443.1 VanZ family protein [Gammaproteobacteria bacterium]MBU4150319.1 VanZ family protein [Gammaproteobacteria bacterium]